MGDMKRLIFAVALLLASPAVGAVYASGMCSLEGFSALSGMEASCSGSETKDRGGDNKETRSDQHACKGEEEGKGARSGRVACSDGSEDGKGGEGSKKEGRGAQDATV
jgi:hypothetical protein